jgi:hypothetical protein
MPRYFFSLEGGGPDDDAEGTELSGPDVARDEAVRTMADMLKDMDGAVWRGGEWVMRVTDEAGDTVGTLHFRGTKGPGG